MKEIIEFSSENMHKINFNMIDNKVYATNIDEDNVFVGRFEFLFNKWIFIPEEGFIWDYNIQKIWDIKRDKMRFVCGATNEN